MKSKHKTYGPGYAAWWQVTPLPGAPSGYAGVLRAGDSGLRVTAQLVTVEHAGGLPAA